MDADVCLDADINVKVVVNIKVGGVAHVGVPVGVKCNV